MRHLSISKDHETPSASKTLTLSNISKTDVNNCPCFFQTDEEVSGSGLVIADEPEEEAKGL